MSNVVDKTAGLLMDQLKRLDVLTVAKGERMAESVERMKAECERAKAVNETARNIIGLGELHVKAEMLQMNRPERAFRPGEMFAERMDVDATRNLPPARRATAWGDGGKTRINELGEFEDED